LSIEKRKNKETFSNFSVLRARLSVYAEKTLDIKQKRLKE
jgi:hypothetical protein